MAETTVLCEGFVIVAGNGERAGKPDWLIVRPSREACERRLTPKHPRHRVIPVRVVRLDESDEMPAAQPMSLIVEEVRSNPLPVTGESTTMIDTESARAVNPLSSLPLPTADETNATILCAPFEVRASIFVHSLDAAIERANNGGRDEITMGLEIARQLRAMIARIRSLAPMVPMVIIALALSACSDFTGPTCHWEWVTRSVPVDSVHVTAGDTTSNPIVGITVTMRQKVCP